MNRRDFIKDILRGVVLILMAITGIALVNRKQSKTSGCLNLPCADCRQLSSCKLPRADDYRATERKKVFTDQRGLNNER